MCVTTQAQRKWSQGDAFIFAPNEPHQITNSGEEDLLYYVVADNPIGESAYYPDSGKWKVNKSPSADRVLVKGKRPNYFDGETQLPRPLPSLLPRPHRA